MTCVQAAVHADAMCRRTPRCQGEWQLTVLATHEFSRMVAGTAELLVMCLMRYRRLLLRGVLQDPQELDTVLRALGTGSSGP